jgi:transposase
VIVFVDESGLSERPHKVRTWSPRGQTPILQYHFTWKTISVVAGLSLCNFYFRIFNGSIKSPQIIEFLTHLIRHLPGRLLLIWDGAAIHRSRLVKSFIESLDGRILVERLPAYAPELNPTEYIWGHWKNHELPNFCPKNCWELSVHATRALRRMRRRPMLITAFWKQAELF